MVVFPIFKKVGRDERPSDHRSWQLMSVQRALSDVIREAYDQGLEDGRKWDGDNNPYRGQEVEAELGKDLFTFVQNFASAESLPGGVPDLTTFDEIAEELDEAEVPRHRKEGPITLLKRVSVLVSMLEDERGYVEELRGEAERVSADFEGDLWKANRRILDRLGFDWRTVDCEGVTADDVEDFIIDGITRLERQARPPQKPLPITITERTGDKRD